MWSAAVEYARLCAPQHHQGPLTRHPRRATFRESTDNADESEAPVYPTTERAERELAPRARSRRRVVVPAGSAQALLRGSYYYVGVGIGSYIGGVLIDERGFVFMYRAGAVAMLAWALLWAPALALASACGRKDLAGGRQQ